jgi:hypothetical protein
VPSYSEDFVLELRRRSVRVTDFSTGRKLEGWSAFGLQLTPPWNMLGIILLLRTMSSGLACLPIEQRRHRQCKDFLSTNDLFSNGLIYGIQDEAQLMASCG